MVFSIGAGMLIVISSVFATRFARVQEAVYYKILGAKGRFVWGVFTLENALIGTISGLSALALAQTGSWLIATRLFHVAYQPFAVASVVMVVFTCAAVIVTGLAASRSIVRKKPARFLQEQTRE
jgi:putative ABC transport system permease protein